MNNHIKIDNRYIGHGYQPYIIAEISANHNGNISKALTLIKTAAECGADAVKIQTYTPDTMTIDCHHKDFQINGGLWHGYSLYELYQKAHTPFEWHEELYYTARKAGIPIFSTPFDETAVDLLESLNTPAYKIASFEITDLPLIRYVAKTGKPMIISTGMASFAEINEAVEVSRTSGCNDIILLHCTSAYPTPPKHANLKMIQDISHRLDILTGLSDHTLGTTVAIAGVATGACVIEKHFTLDRRDKGADSDFSIEPDELKQLVIETKIAHEAIGVVNYNRSKSERDNKAFRRSLYFIKDIKKGERITKQHIRRIRPGYGLPPKYYDLVIGCTSTQDIKRGTAATKDLIVEELN